MSKTASRIIKFVLFPIIFYFICLVVAFFFRDDAIAYSRILMHEFNTQEKIDILFCGASHVSHGLLPSLMDEKLGKSTFCAGTPSQVITETYAIIKNAVSSYDIEEIYLEMDLDFANSAPANIKRQPSDSMFLATHYLSNNKVKFEHVLENVHPAYYIDAMLPIGQGKLIDLDPAVFIRNVKTKISGDYYRYVYKNEGSEYKEAIEYKGKGCIFVQNTVEKGTYVSDGQNPVPIEKISKNFDLYITKIIELCKEKNIRLVFYGQPNSDFYNCDIGNYDEYYLYIKNLVESKGYSFYDFNLCKEKFLFLEDTDFCDTNHFNENGIRKFTTAFCEFYKANDKKNMFHETYQEKLLSQRTRILGLVLKETDDKKSVKIVPILNNGDSAKISYTVKANLTGGGNEILLENSTKDIIAYPENCSGEFEIHAYYDGIEHCHVKMPFVSM